MIKKNGKSNRCLVLTLEVISERYVVLSNPVLMMIDVSYAGDEVLIDVPDK